MCTDALSAEKVTLVAFCSGTLSFVWIFFLPMTAFFICLVNTLKKKYLQIVVVEDSLVLV